MEGYMLWTATTSAESPIVYGRFRPRPGNGPQARPWASPHDCFDHHVKAPCVAVTGGWDHSVGPPNSRLRRPTRCRVAIGRASQPFGLIPTSLSLGAKQC